MCTVTRPGVASLASSIAVELLITILQHPRGIFAPASTEKDEIGSSNDENIFGPVPHQIRGFLRTFSNLKIAGPAYNHCSACSESIVHEYRRDSFGLVLRACNEKGYIERLSGLNQVQKTAMEAIADIDWDEDEENGDSDFEAL